MNNCSCGARVRLSGLLIGFCLVLAGCGGGGGGGSPPDPPTPPPPPPPDPDTGATFDVEVTGVGHANYESPHSNPLALLPDGSRLYVANTPADTVDVIDTATNAVVARVNVGIDPVGVAVRPDGREVWVGNHVSDSVSVIDADPDSSTHHHVLATIQSFDEPVGIAFASDAKAYVALSSSNRIAVVDVASRRITSHLEITAQDPRALAVQGGRLYVVPFESNNQTQLSGCHPDGHTDQLLWVLDTPLCDVGCDQIQPRLVQDIRGLRGSAPYHWDGIPGDPFGGVNTANLLEPIEPNCDKDVPESCTLHVLEGSLATTMCDYRDCETNDEGKAGPLSGAERAAMAKYLLSVPYPPSVERPYTNAVTGKFKEGVRKFQLEKQCGNCHRQPFWTVTNMGGSGMDVPSWRGASDRWKNAPQNRFFFADRVRGDTRGFPERYGFVDDQDMYQMILEGSVGFSGSLGRQATLSSTTARLTATTDLLDALEQSASEGGIVLQGEGIRIHDDGSTETLALQFSNDAYEDTDGADESLSREALLDSAAAGDVLVTVTARLGYYADYEHPQPTLRPVELPVLPMFPGGRPADFPELYVNEAMRIRGEHIREGAYVLIDGRRVFGGVECETGTLPDCDDDVIVVEFDELPTEAGLHLLQVQNPEGLFSNDFPFFVLDAPLRAESGNLISSGGTFDDQGAWNANTTNASVTWNGEVDFAIDEPSAQKWRVQLSHAVAIEADVEYSICYSAKAEASRYLEVNVDTAASDYRGLMGTGFTPEVGAATRGTGTILAKEYHQFRHRFVGAETDSTARLVFDLAQSDVDLQIDDVGLYRGRGCGDP